MTTSDLDAMTTASRNLAAERRRSESEREKKIIDWLFKINEGDSSLAEHHPSQQRQIAQDDWQAVASLCGHQAEDFVAAGADLPLTAAEIDYFRRNHRDTDSFVARDFLAAREGLPSPLAELYGLYRHRARRDAESALFIAQATGSTRVARNMADMLAVGSFAGSMEFVTHMTMSYSVAAAFDTSDIIDRVNQEATRRLALPGDHPAHLLTLSPDEISILASNIAERNALNGADFLEKANLLAQARQDVNRLPQSKQFVTSIGERDLPLNLAWVSRICTAYAHLFESWVIGMAEIEAIVNPKPNISYQ